MQEWVVGSMSEGNNVQKWVVSSAEFRGFVKAKLENQEVVNIEIKTMNANQNKRINKVETDVSNIKGQAGVVGGVIALTVTVVMWIINKFRGG